MLNHTPRDYGVTEIMDASRLHGHDIVNRFDDLLEWISVMKSVDIVAESYSQ